MRISGNVFDGFGEYFNTLGEYIFMRKYFQGTYFWNLGLENYKFHGRGHKSEI